MRVTFLLSLLVIQLAFAQQPRSPLWPNQFAQDFVETFIIDDFGYTNVGTYQYDASAGSSRLSRSNGKYDPFCSGYKDFDKIDAPCEHLTFQNTRYMYYPDTNDCCYCCNASQGCGILSRDWMKDGEFLGETTINGAQAYLWVKYEGEDLPNYLWETTEENPVERTILKIARNNYEENFIKNQARHNIQSITLPSSCSLKNLCLEGVCPELRDDDDSAQF